MSTDESVEIDEKVEDEGENLVVAVKNEAKVVLDTDDAPFLAEEPAKKPEKSVAASKAGGLLIEDDESQKGWSKKKKIIVSCSGLALFLLISAALVWFFVFRDSAVIIDPEIIVIPSIKEDVVPQEFYVNLEPFLIELENEQGEPVFLVFKFAAFTKSQMLAREAENKVLILRDAVYYYLTNKTHIYLIDPKNADIIKDDLASVLSGYLAGGKIDGILFESYLTKEAYTGYDI